MQFEDRSASRESLGNIVAVSIKVYERLGFLPGRIVTRQDGGVAGVHGDDAMRRQNSAAGADRASPLHSVRF